MSGEEYEFYNSVELDDIHMSLCNRENKADFMTQLCYESQRLFNESDDLHYKQQWLQINIKTLMEHERNENSTRDTDLHVLQWRHGCAVEHHSNGSVMFLHGTDEYAYDGETLTFDLSVHWKPLVLDHDIIWDRESVSSLERRCVETLTRFAELQREGKFIMESRPDVHTRVKASGSPGSSLLVCLATGFYPKHVQMEIRRDQTPFPDDQLNSEGIRPNADGSFQLKKSLEILPSETSQYQCVVEHQTRTEPLVISWVEVNVLLPLLVGFIVALVVLAIILLVFYLRRKCVKRRSFIHNHQDLSLQLPEPPKLPESPKLPEPPKLPKLPELPEPPKLSPKLPESLESSRSFRRSRSFRPFGGDDYNEGCLLGRVQRRCGQTPICGAGDLDMCKMEPWLAKMFEEKRAERCEAALNTDSEEENPTDPSVEEVHTEEVHTEEPHDTQSLCETEATAAARGAMGSKNISLPNVAMEREDADQNTVTQNALLLPLPRRCRSKDISLPNLTQDRKDSDDSS